MPKVLILTGDADGWRWASGDPTSYCRLRRRWDGRLG